MNIVVDANIIKKEKLSWKAARLLSMLGKPWTKKIIDLELCVYRDLGTYDIEVSCDGKTFDIYVWQKSPLYIRERRYDLPDVDAAYNVCRKFETRYSAPCV